MKTKLKIVKLNVKHILVADEIAALNLQFRQHDRSAADLEDEAKSVKKGYDAKIAAEEAIKSRIGTTLDAGFEFRDKDCVRVLDIKAGKKFHYLAEVLDADTGELPADAKPIQTEPLTDEDRQTELFEAEQAFEKLEAIALFPEAGADIGILKVGRLNDKWFSAVDAVIGKTSHKERLDGDQPAFKKRADAVKKGLKRFLDFIEATTDRETMKGFENHANLVLAEHAERVE